MAEGGYLPPVVIEVTGDAKPWYAVAEEVKASLADLAKESPTVTVAGDANPLYDTISKVEAALSGVSKTVATPKVGADADILYAKLAQAQSALGAFASQVANSKLGADTAPFWAEILELRALLLRDPVTLDVDADILPALAKIAELRGALSLAKIASLTQATHPGLSYFDNAATQAAIAGATTAGKSDQRKALDAFTGALVGLGWGHASGGLLNRLLSPLTALGTIFGAEFGSLGSLAGFGPEHLLLTGVGLAGSMAGGGIGAGLLGLGALGVAGVGFGTDLAGTGQAMGDIKNVLTAQNALNSAIAEYGPKSYQAAEATYQMDSALGGFNPVARGAVVAAANAIQGFKTMFDQYTGLAEKYGAQLITQAVHVGETYLPTIGKFAAQNTQIIRWMLQPLFTWLEGPGLKIFTLLEEKFQKDLPTAMAAFDNGVELLIRTIGYIAPQTGGFIRDLDRFFTKYNTVGWDKWTSEIQKMINLARQWGAFFKILIEDIADIFSKSAGLGSGIIGLLTTYLDRLHQVLNVGSGGDKLSTLFKLHKQEMLDLITAIVQVGKSFTTLYLTAAPDMVRVATFLLRILDIVLEIANKVPFGSFILGTALLLAKFGVLGSALRLIRSLLFGVSGEATTAERAVAGIGGGLGSGLKRILSAVGIGGGEADAAGGAGLAATGSSLSTLLPFLAPVALGLGAIAGSMALVHHIASVTPSVVQAFTHGVQNLNASNSLPALTSNLDAVNSRLAYMRAHPPSTWSSIFPDSSRFAAGIDLMQAYNRDVQQLATYKTNVAGFASALGVSAGAVNQLADALGIHLYSSLGKTQTVWGHTFTTPGANAAADIADLSKMRSGLATMASQAGTTSAGLVSLSATSGLSFKQIVQQVNNAVAATTGSWASFTSGLTTGAENASGSLSAFYTSQEVAATKFTSNIQKAIAKGYNPAYIAQLAQQGPAQAGALLQKLVDAQGKGLSTLINQTSNTLVNQATIAKDQIKILQIGIVGSGAQAGKDLQAALALLGTSTSSNISSAITLVLLKYKLNLSDVQRIAAEYGSALPTAIRNQITQVANAAATLGISFATGMAGGINSAVNSIALAATHGAEAGLKAARAAIEASSPARRPAREVGLPFAQGAAMGIIQGTGLFVAASRRMALLGVSAASGVHPGNYYGTSASGGGRGGGMTLIVNATFNINAPGGNPGAIKQAVMGDASSRFAKQLRTAMSAGAGRIY